MDFGLNCKSNQYENSRTREIFYGQIWAQPHEKFTHIRHGIRSVEGYSSRSISNALLRYIRAGSYTLSLGTKSYIGMLASLAVERSLHAPADRSQPAIK